MEKIINLIGDKLILKGSEEEMKILSGENDIYKAMNHFNYFDFKGIFIMTLGEAGSLILKKGEKILNIPAFQSSGVIDETGAGDVYFAIFANKADLEDQREYRPRFHPAQSAKVYMYQVRYQGHRVVYPEERLFGFLFFQDCFSRKVSGSVFSPDWRSPFQRPTPMSDRPDSAIG